MTGYYTGKVEAGKIYACKSCGKLPVVGEERYYEKKGEVWLGCVDFECFKKQGGSSEPSSKSGGGKFQSNKFPITEATKIYDLAEGILESFLKKRTVPIQNPQGQTQGDPIFPQMPVTEQAIFIESLMRTLSGNFKP